MGSMNETKNFHFFSSITEIPQKITEYPKLKTSDDSFGVSEQILNP